MTSYVRTPPAPEGPVSGVPLQSAPFLPALRINKLEIELEKQPRPIGQLAGLRIWPNANVPAAGDHVLVILDVHILPCLANSKRTQVHYHD